MLGKLEKRRREEMIEEIEKLKAEAGAFAISEKNSLEDYRLKFLSRNGLLNKLFEDFKKIPNDQKKEMGQHLNVLKTFVQQKFDETKEQLEESETTDRGDFDFSMPTTETIGSRHPLNIIQNQILEVFANLGFTVAQGPEIESDWYNFSALNFPENHPARDMQDTFFVDKDFALRTHTTSVQIRVLEHTKPPVRMISPGRVYRNEAISARAHCFFHQVDGFYVDKGVSFADLKHTLYTFVNQLFGSDTDVRFRPSYFPFTEVSAEMDCTCFLCKGAGCNVCKYTGWVEILGSGMIDPAVLKNCGIDPEEYSGFAFGMGVERIAMLKYNVKDLRMYSENNVKFLNQFKGVL
jgi:phenylalanyl-tRNA synthetase alpha chain